MTDAADVAVTVAAVKATLEETTAALTAVEMRMGEINAALTTQNAYLHQRVHDLAQMIAVVHAAVGLLWEKSGLREEIGPLQLRELSPLPPNE